MKFKQLFFWLAKGWSLTISCRTVKPIFMATIHPDWDGFFRTWNLEWSNYGRHGSSQLLGPGLILALALASDSPSLGPDEAKLKPRSPGGQAKPEHIMGSLMTRQSPPLNQKTSGNASKRVIPVIAFQNAPELSAVALDIVVQRQCVLLSEDRWKEEIKRQSGWTTSQVTTGAFGVQGNLNQQEAHPWGFPPERLKDDQKDGSGTCLIFGYYRTVRLECSAKRSEGGALHADAGRKPEIVAEGGVGEFKRASDGLGDGKQSSPCFRDNVGGVQRRDRSGAVYIPNGCTEMLEVGDGEMCEKIDRCCRRASRPKMSNRRGRCSAGGGSEQGEIEMKDEATEVRAQLEDHYGSG
ncbi:hypothetical protein B0H14DRAFT_2598412 [Mycena olivaceomarginata]|nr:hypothetical protein B0H14DRAFT_2598412 [Mycena olivaceomarginata]